MNRGTHVYSREGTEFGVTTGSVFPCKQEGCRSQRVSVRWPDNKVTYPCRKGLTVRLNNHLDFQLI